MQKSNTRYNDVKPSQLKKHDRIHTAAGLFEVKSIRTNGDDYDLKNYVLLNLRPVWPKGKKAVLIVHKSARFSTNRPHKK